jgi:UDP-N-acetylmuramyl pentapeptide phosphotransferase/UDP-N-acetylglucosamine-1-phosphate transferase
MSLILYAGVLSLTVALTAVSLLSSRLRDLAIDRPNERSLHKVPTPRTGGIGILVGTTAGAWLGWSQDVAVIWGLALTLGSVSFIDDRWGLPIAVRFATQLFTAAVAVWLAVRIENTLWFVISALAIAWMTNLYNFMDGSDGLAGGMGGFGFAAYAVAALSVGGCIAFLRYNLPPAKIFMGDVGSTVLGFSASTLGLYGFTHELWPLWFPALSFLPFIADASVTIARRALRREKIWEAHRTHYYQRLVLSGWSHQRLALYAYLLMLGTSVSALAAQHGEPSVGWVVLAIWLVAIGGLMLAVDVRWLRHSRASGS